ncbi:MAG: hypothetical protein LUC41_08540 [Clostridiales bacterium]|nr:hypothetical protein [Clostridiales bacterium]
MDKYEYKLKLDELKELVDLKDYKRAGELADTISWKKVRNAKTLLMVANVYEALERYDSCREVLLQAYEHSTAGRNIVSQLAEIAIKARNVGEAEEYYNEFLEMAPRDNQRYVLAYKISCLKNAPLSDRIAILEEFKEKEYTEMWAYELAVLYSQAGMREKCVETCDELVIWFGDGEYVERALDLKRSFQPLTPSQEEKYQKFHSQKGMVEINIPQKTEPNMLEAGVVIPGAVTQPEMTVTASKFNTANLQEELNRSMKQIMEATEENTVRDTLKSIRKIVQDIPYLEGEEQEAISSRAKIREEVNEELKADFKERMGEETGEDAAERRITPAETAGMSIEEILADWEKTKKAAQAAIEAAEQRKLDLEKKQALDEANQIMKRLDELVPILSAAPGEDMPKSGGTVADTVLSEQPIQMEKATPKQSMTEDISYSALAAAAAESAAAMVRKQAAQAAAKNEQTDVTVQEQPEEAASSVLPVPTEEPVQNAAVGEQPVSEVPTQPAPARPVMDEDAALEQILAQEMSAVAAEEVGEGEDFFDEPDDEEMRETESLEHSTVPAAGSVAGTVPVTPAAEPPVSATKPVLETRAAVAPMGIATDAEGGVILSDEIKDMFTYFIPIPGMPEQISQALGNIVRAMDGSPDSVKGNMVIIGEEGSGKTVMAQNLIKAVQKMTGTDDRKIGKISASAVNKRDFAVLAAKVGGGYLIIEKAGELTPEAVAHMSAAMEGNTGGLTVILEDNSVGIRHALAMDSSFAEKFTGKVNIPIFTIDELVDFGRSYAVEMGCQIDEMAILALYNRINNIQKLDQPTTLAEVKDILDKAIEHAEGGGIKKIFAKKYNDEDNLILREEDFD